MTREELDAVTIGEIREVKTQKRNDRIDTLVKLLKSQFVLGDQTPRQTFDSVIEAVEELRELDSLAGLPNLIETFRK